MTGVLLAVGETMAMLAPSDGGGVIDAAAFLVDAGGAESNVAAHAAALGMTARWHSRLGADALGDRVLRQVAARGVDAASVVRDLDRPTGLYVKDPGRGVRYYRRGSAASALTEGDAEDLALDGVDVLHVSGITAALSSSARAFLVAAMARARALGVTVSFDVNHRAALWSAADAGPVLADLATAADVVFVGRDEAETLWATPRDSDVRALLDGVAELVVKDGDVGATAFHGEARTFVPALRVEVLDAVGAGDAFAGGYLAARSRGLGVAARLAAGHERAALTLRTLGDSLHDTAALPASTLRPLDRSDHASR
ncbi:sugar kinase [Microbacterium sp. CFBP 13617]|uniref:sugar kinase n=1 Tax=Microbacterium sp. CFBP 13617 TaxID=2774035 RepID=UPI0017849D1C|nr:sugar kinase [Microbacterium sp. CFBP 13617]MBD8217836.1 sugar kinase [Microbacterium sp. CFBP 13617]